MTEQNGTWKNNFSILKKWYILNVGPLLAMKKVDLWIFSFELLKDQVLNPHRNGQFLQSELVSIVDNHAACEGQSKTDTDDLKWIAAGNYP